MNSEEQLNLMHERIKATVVEWFDKLVVEESARRAAFAKKNNRDPEKQATNADLWDFVDGIMYKSNDISLYIDMQASKQSYGKERPIVFNDYRTENQETIDYRTEVAQPDFSGNQWKRLNPVDVFDGTTRFDEPTHSYYYAPTQPAASESDEVRLMGSGSKLATFLAEEFPATLPVSNEITEKLGIVSEKKTYMSTEVMYLRERNSGTFLHLVIESFLNFNWLLEGWQSRMSAHMNRFKVYRTFEFFSFLRYYRYNICKTPGIVYRPFRMELTMSDTLPREDAAMFACAEKLALENPGESFPEILPPTLFGGQPDILYEIVSTDESIAAARKRLPPGGKLLRIDDWKRVKPENEKTKKDKSKYLFTEKNVDNHLKYSIQLWFYKYILERNTPHRVYEMHLVKLHPQTVEKWDVPNFPGGPINYAITNHIAVDVMKKEDIEADLNVMIKMVALRTERLLETMLRGASPDPLEFKTAKYFLGEIKSGNNVIRKDGTAVAKTPIIWRRGEKLDLSVEKLEQKLYDEEMRQIAKREEEKREWLAEREAAERAAEAEVSSAKKQRKQSEAEVAAEAAAEAEAKRAAEAAAAAEEAKRAAEAAAAAEEAKRAAEAAAAAKEAKRAAEAAAAAEEAKRAAEAAAAAEEAKRAAEAAAAAEAKRAAETAAAEEEAKRAAETAAAEDASANRPAKRGRDAADALKWAASVKKNTVKQKGGVSDEGDFAKQLDTLMKNVEGNKRHVEEIAKPGEDVSDEKIQAYSKSAIETLRSAEMLAENIRLRMKAVVRFIEIEEDEPVKKSLEDQLKMLRESLEKNNEIIEKAKNNHNFYVRREESKRLRILHQFIACDE